MDEPPQHANKTVVMPESLWTTERARLRAALENVDSLFADLYRRAIDALSENPLTQGSLVVAGHCIRDLVNGLPDLLPDVPGVPGYSDVSGTAQLLAVAWDQHEIHLEHPNSDESEDVSRRTVRLVTVPFDVLRAAHAVVRASSDATDNARRRQSALVLGRLDTGQNATMRVFRESVQIFERLRHPARNRPVDIRKKGTDDVLRALVNVEGALIARLGSFFATVESLTDLLDIANAREEDPDGRS